MSILEKLGYGGLVTLTGMVIVFAILIILIFAITVMAKLLNAGKKEAKPAAAPAPVPAPVAEPAAPVVEEVAEEADEEEEVPAEVFAAAIAAAIAAYDTPEKPLVVRSVRRAPGWKRAARQDQVYRF